VEASIVKSKAEMDQDVVKQHITLGT